MNDARRNTWRKTPEAAFELDARHLELWQQWDSKRPNNPFILRQLEAVRHP